MVMTFITWPHNALPADMLLGHLAKVALWETDRRSQLVPENAVTGMCVLTGQRRAGE